MTLIECMEDTAGPSINFSCLLNRPFYRYGGHFEFIKFMEYFRALFGQKENFNVYFSGKKAIIITSKHGTAIFFYHYNLFLGRLKEKLARKARVTTEASISDRSHAPWESHNTP